MQSLWMVAASLLFACMGVCVKLGSAQFSAAELVFWRGFIATLLIGAYVIVRRLTLATPHASTHVIRGLAGFAALVMYFYAISMIPLVAANCVWAGNGTKDLRWKGCSVTTELMDGRNTRP